MGKGRGPMPLKGRCTATWNVSSHHGDYSVQGASPEDPKDRLTG